MSLVHFYNEKGIIPYGAVIEETEIPWTNHSLVHYEVVQGKYADCIYALSWGRNYTDSTYYCVDAITRNYRKLFNASNWCHRIYAIHPTRYATQFYNNRIELFKSDEV